MMEKMDNKEVNRVVAELKSAGTNRASCTSSLYGALIMMRTTLIKTREVQAQLIHAGCIPLLLDLLTPPIAKGNWLKTVDIVISILANMCLEEEAREQVITSKGLSIIVEATKCTEKESIHNRGVRAVANLIHHSSKSDVLCNEIFDLELPTFVAKKLMETKEKECKQTYLRAIRLFGQGKDQFIRLIEDSRSVQAVACVLKEEDEKLKHKSLRILHEFSGIRCCANFAEQILAANILEDLVQATENMDDEVSSLALSIVLKLCEHENIRPPLGAAGFISTLMRLMDCERSHVNHVSLMNALCLCCFEAVNRHRLYQGKSLELFMSTLSSEQLNKSGKFSVLQDRIISCFVCFLYNDECFDKLLDLKLVPVIIGHLKRVCNLQMPEGDWNKETEMILNEKKFGVKESLFNINDEISNGKDDQNLTCLSENVTAVEEDKDCNGTNAEISCTTESLDQEIMDICMDDTEIIPSSSTQEDRHTFSINSPTYQMEQNSWRLEDHTSGITCKNYSEDPHQDDVISPKLVSEGSGKFSPYSPLSAGSSYYSPAYPSPAHSLGSSPRHSNFQTGSFRLGSMSPRSSPTWSPSSSVHSEDTWSGSDQAGTSPTNIMLSPNSNHGQFSPLIHPYPASPPPIFSLEDRHMLENQLCNSQRSNASNLTVDSQEDIFSEFSKPLFSEESHQGSNRFPTLSGGLHTESQKPVYSASEEEDDENDNLNLIDKKYTKPEDTLISTDNDKAKAGSGTCLNEKIMEGKRSEKNVDHECSTKSIKSMSTGMGTEDENVAFPLLLSPATSGSFVRQNSEPFLSTASRNKINSSSFEKTVTDAQPTKKIKQSLGDFLSSSQPLNGKGTSVKKGKNNFAKQCSFPGKKSTLSTFGNQSPHSPSCSSSPCRVQLDMPFHSPSMSPFSRYSNSPYASPNPYYPRTAEKNLSAHDVFGEGSSKMDNNSIEKKLKSSEKTGIQSSTQSQLPLSTAFQERSLRTFSKMHPNSDQPSTSKSFKDKDSDRLNRIKRKTEENILVLLSRISVKTDPSPHLPKYAILSILTQYIAVVPNPLQRCIRTLFRVFQSPHCFECVLLEQAPALIVKNLIMDKDGKLPSVLFKDQNEEKLSAQQTRREINFDEIFASSQSSETPSDFELKIQFEFGGDAYSDMVHHQGNFRSDIFQPNYFYRDKFMSHCISRDSSYLYSSMSPEDLIRVRIRSGMNLMKAITSLALSRYGDGEIKRIWSRGTASEKLMCAISLLHMPIGCGPLHRRQIILKHDAFHQVIPFLFCTESPLVRESIVTALSLLGHLFRIKKVTPKVSKLTNSFPESTICCSHNDNITGFKKNGEGKVSTSVFAKDTQNFKKETIHSTCKLEHLSLKLNLNLIVCDSSSQNKKVFRACKEILMKNSDVFSAMFSGGYAEADKVDIEFSDVDLSGFEYILHYLHGCESGCAVIDWLSFVGSNNVNDCDDDKNCRLDTQDSLKMKESALSKKCSSDSDSSPLKSSAAAARKTEDLSSQVDECEDECLKETIVTGNDTAFQKSLDLSPNSCNLLEKNLSEVKTSCTNETDDCQTIKQIDFILDKCIDIISVADRFLLHDLIKYLTSVLSYTCLYTRTVTDVIHLASSYKLSGLVTDCIVEVLLSHTSGKDKAALFQTLGVELDSDVKKMLIDALTNLFITEAERS